MKIQSYENVFNLKQNHIHNYDFFKHIGVNKNKITYKGNCVQCTPIRELNKGTFGSVNLLLVHTQDGNFELVSKTSHKTILEEVSIIEKYPLLLNSNGIIPMIIKNNETILMPYANGDILNLYGNLSFEQAIDIKVK